MTQYIITINCHYEDDEFAELAMEQAVKHAVESIGSSATSPQHSIHVVGVREDSSGTREDHNYTLEAWENE